jgi:hypothetical protein
MTSLTAKANTGSGTDLLSGVTLADGFAGNSVLVDAAGNSVGTTPAGTSNGLNTQLTGITFTLSTLNSSTAQLASGATFTGTIESTFNQPAGQILIVCDQPYTVFADQFDGANNRISTDTFTRLGGVPTNETIQINADSFRIRVTNNGPVTTTGLRIETTYGPLTPLPRVNSNLGNFKTALNEINGAPVDTGLGASTAGTVRVAISSDSAGVNPNGLDALISDSLATDGNGIVGNSQVDPDAGAFALRVEVNPRTPLVLDQTVILPTGGLGPDGVLRTVQTDTSGRLVVNSSGFTQPISGSVSVSNLPATQTITGAITGTVAATLPATNNSQQSMQELLLQIAANGRAITHLLTQILAVSRGQVDPPPSDEADALIGEYLNPLNNFTNLTN